MTNSPRSGKAKRTRKRHKKANRDRSARFELPGIGQFNPDRGPDEVVSDLHHEGHYGGLSENDQPKVLFDAAHTLEEVPLGILSHKEEPLPVELLPTSSQELLDLCTRLISVVPDKHLVALIVSGWPAGNLVGLETHVANLWHLRESDYDLYRYLVCGQHYCARTRALEGRRPEGWTQAAFDHVLARMALLWCARDVQVTFARNARLESNPFGTVAAPSLPSGKRLFLDSSYRVLSPETVVEIARPDHAMFERTLAMRGKPEKDQKNFLKNEGMNSRRFRRAHGDAKRSYAGGSGRVSSFLVHEQVARAKEEKERLEQTNPFWRHLANPVAEPPLARTFAQLCLTGLTVVTANAVSILRYCQAEKEIEQLIARTEDAGAHRPFSGSMSGYTAATLDAAGMKRARNLLRAYRARFPDKDFASVSGSAQEPHYPGEILSLPGIGQRPLNAAAEFLLRCGARRPEDHHGPIASERRTFYLLDVLPDLRLSR